MDLSKLKSEFILGNVPLATLLIIHTGEVEYKIMASDIKNITIEYSDANFLIGLGAGLAIDLLFLALTFDLEIHLGPPATK